MDIVAVIGSPHGPRGNTAALVRYLLAGASAAGAAVEEVHLSAARVLPCKGCDLCHRRGVCPHDDEFEVIKRKILDAEGIVLASPNYIGNVSAQMKAFMDRCSSVIHCTAFREKFGAVAVTSGGGGELAVAAYVDHFLMATGTVPVGSVWATVGSREPGDIPVEAQTQARRLGAELVEACAGRRRYPEAEATVREFERRMQGLVSEHREDWAHEYDYWQVRGVLPGERTG